MQLTFCNKFYGTSTVSVSVETSTPGIGPRTGVIGFNCSKFNSLSSPYRDLLWVSLKAVILKIKQINQILNIMIVYVNTVRKVLIEHVLGL